MGSLLILSVLSGGINSGVPTTRSSVVLKMSKRTHLFNSAPEEGIMAETSSYLSPISPLFTSHPFKFSRRKSADSQLAPNKPLPIMPLMSLTTRTPIPQLSNSPLFTSHFSKFSRPKSADFHSAPYITRVPPPLMSLSFDPHSHSRGSSEQWSYDDSNDQAFAPPRLPVLEIEQAELAVASCSRQSPVPSLMSLDIAFPSRVREFEDDQYKTLSTVSSILTKRHEGRQI